VEGDVGANVGVTLLDEGQVRFAWRQRAQACAVVFDAEAVEASKHGVDLGLGLAVDSAGLGADVGDARDAAGWNRELTAVRMSSTALDEIVGDKVEGAAESIMVFSEMCLAHPQAPPSSSHSGRSSFSQHPAAPHRPFAQGEGDDAAECSYGCGAHLAIANEFWALKRVLSKHSYERWADRHADQLRHQQKQRRHAAPQVIRCHELQRRQGGRRSERANTEAERHDNEYGDAGCLQRGQRCD